MGELEFRVLGPLEVRHAGDLVPVRGVRERAVLAVLLLEAGRVVPLGRLVEAVWDGDPPSAAEKAIRNAVSALRGRLAQAGAAEPLIETNPSGYRLHIGGGLLDAAVFAGHAVAARELAASGQFAEAVVKFRDALGLWRGPALAGLRGLVLEAAAARLDEQRLAVWEDCLDAELKLGRHREVTGELRALAGEHPLRERLAWLLMLALYRSGLQADALDAYHRLAKRLVGDLGLDPSGEITGLHVAILRHDQALDLPAGTQGRRDTAPAPAQLPRDVPGFVGRAAELGQLHALLPDALHQAGAQSGQHAGEMVVISAIGGTAGVGKTALAVHFARQVADQFPDGQLYANLRGFDPSAGPVPAAEVLAGFLLSLGAGPDAILGGVDAQAGLYRSMLDGKRMLVLLDNARDASQVRPLLPGSPACMVIVTSRSQLTGLVAAEGARSLTLDLLSEDEARDLLVRRLGADRLNSEADAAEELTALCARLPLALSILAARAAARSHLALSELTAELRDTRRQLDVFETGDPATDMRAVFSWSYRQLSANAARMFRLLGLHPGPDVTAPAAASLSALSGQEAHRLLAELSRAHLVIEHAPGRFIFHDLLRAYAVEQARDLDSDAGRRAAICRLLDHYLHSALAATRAASPGRRLIKLADPEPGVTPERFTGNPDALAWFDAEYRVLLAATSLAADNGLDTRAWQLPWTLSRFQHRRGYWHERVSSQRVALAAVQRLGDPVAQARVHYELAWAYNEIGHDDDTVHGKLAYDLFKRLGDTEAQGISLGMISRTLERQGRWPEALEYAQQYLALCQEAGSETGTGNAFNSVAWCYAHLGDYLRARDCCEQALAIARELDEPLSSAWASDTLGYTHYRAGDFAEAAAGYRDALRFFQEVGARAERARTLVRLGDVHDSAGDRDAARECWQEALDLFDELRLADGGEVRARLARAGTLKGTMPD